MAVEEPRLSMAKDARPVVRRRPQNSTPEPTPPPRSVPVEFEIRVNGALIQVTVTQEGSDG